MQKEFKDENLEKTFNYVFDSKAMDSIHSLAVKKHLNQIEFVVSTGKEAHVFRAIDNAGNYIAVKVYKIATSTFQDMEKYIKGDNRFKKIKKEKREIVYAWTRKEFKNLQLCIQAGVKAPIPIAFQNNVLVMSFIGKKGEAAATLREAEVEDWKKVYEQVVENIAKMLYKAKLIHADLSEYNILYEEGKIYFIDLGQAVLSSHPKAREFFERDCKNIANYFQKKIPEISEKKIVEDVRRLEQERKKD